MTGPYVDWIAVLERIEANDASAFAELTHLIVGWLRRYRAHEHLTHADDLIQNVTVILLDYYRGSRLRDPEAFVNFVGTVVRNQLRLTVRQQARMRAHAPAGDLSELELQLRADERRDTDPQVVTDLDKALGSLPDRHRAVVEAIYLRGETYGEAAVSLGLAFGTLKRLQREGLRTLREAMGLGKE